MEAVVSVAGRFARSDAAQPKTPRSILVLRNGDLGDLLVITPLFQALKELFPESAIVAAVGNWNFEILKHNPYVSDILPFNAPWHNKFIKDQSPFQIIRYISSSPEVNQLAQRQFDIGIDILGSTLGSLLMLRAGIPYRLGVRGFAGGHSVVQAYVDYNHYEYVGRAALRFAELLRAKNLPPLKPQIFLAESESDYGKSWWQKLDAQSKVRAHRIVIGPGGGFAEKCWPSGELHRIGTHDHRKSICAIRNCW